MISVDKGIVVMTASLILFVLVNFHPMSTSNSQVVYSSSGDGGVTRPGPPEEKFTSGSIASLQNESSLQNQSRPTWILSGLWNTSLVQELLFSQTNASYSGPSFFNASFEMVKTDGTSRHAHTISKFSERESSASNNNMTLIFNGTATVSMAEGPIENVSTNLTVLNDNILSIWLDPRKTGNHFGDLPIYGMVMK
jgi:hypothetical protein